MFNSFLHEYNQFVKGQIPNSKPAYAQYLLDRIKRKENTSATFVLQGEHYPDLEALDYQDLMEIEDHLNGHRHIPLHRLRELLVNKPNAKLFEELAKLPSPVVG